MDVSKISVIIMTLNAEKYIQNIIDMLKKQTIVPDEIIVVDSQSQDQTVDIEKKNNVKIILIDRKEFDHGGSRDLALRESIGDYVLFLTQDAEIGNERYVENLIRPFNDDKVAMVCGRQIAKKDATSYEQLIREFNYPNKRMTKKKEDIKKLGIKAYYMSDVCSAYRRDIYLQIGGFEHPILTNEDMLIAAKALKNGYKTAYEPDAFVYHSHNFTLKQEFKRNALVGAFLKQHENELESTKVSSEGMALVKYVSKRLLNDRKYIDFCRFGFICVAKYLGNKYGKKCTK